MQPIAVVRIPGPRRSMVRPPFRRPFDAVFSASHEIQRQRLGPRIEHRGGGASFERLERLVAPGALPSADVPRTSHREPHELQCPVQLKGFGRKVSGRPIASEALTALPVPERIARRRLSRLPFQQLFDANRWPFHAFFSASHEFQRQGLASILAR